MGFATVNGMATVSELPVNRNKFDSNVGTLLQKRYLSELMVYQNASDDSSILFSGGPTIKMTSVNGATSYITADIGNTDLSNADFFDLYFYFDDITNLNLLEIDFSNDSNLANRQIFYATTFIKYVDRDGWRFLRIPKSAMNGSSGTPPSWSSIRYIRLQLKSNAGTTINANFGMLAKGSLPKAAVYMYFDDGTVDQYDNAFSTMEKYGLRGTIAVITNNVATTGNVTWGQLREMENAGWLVCGHTHTHVNLSTVDETTMRSEFDLSSRKLRDHGFYFGSKCLVAPFGGWNDLANTVAKDYFAVCRTGTHSDRVNPLMEFPQSHQRYQKYISPYDTDAPATIEGWIDAAISNKEELVLAWHKIVTTTAGQYEYSTANFDTVCAYLRSKIDAGTVIAPTWRDTMIQTQALAPIDSDGKYFLSNVNGDPVVVSI